MVARRTITRGLAQLPNLVDAAVGGRVDLNDIDGIALANLDAGIADAAGFGGGPGCGAYFGAAVESLGHDAGDGGFADAAMAREDVAVGDALLGEGVDEGAGHVVLPGDVRKALWTVFAG